MGVSSPRRMVVPPFLVPSGSAAFPRVGSYLPPFWCPLYESHFLCFVDCPGSFVLDSWLVRRARFLDSRVCALLVTVSSGFFRPLPLPGPLVLDSHLGCRCLALHCLLAVSRCPNLAYAPPLSPAFARRQGHLLPQPCHLTLCSASLR